MGHSEPILRGLLAVRADASTIPPEIKALVEGMNKAFSDFKAEHSKQLDEVRRGLPSSNLEESVGRANASIDRLQKEIEDAHIKIAAAQTGPADTRVKDKEYTESFRAHMRKGDIQASLNKGADAEGGYLAPVEWDRTITNKLVLVSPIRDLAFVQRISGAGYTKLFNMGGTASGWVGEVGARPGTGTATLSPLTYNTGEIYANPAATQQILDDAEIDLETWLAGEVQTEFARQEGLAFVSGDGANKPKGLLTYVTGGANAAAHPYGAITTVNSGSDTAITTDGVIDIIYDLPSAFTSNASWIMNRKTQGQVRKLKDGQGNYIWQPTFVAGQPATLAGFPLREVPDMPDVAANAIAAMFGDFKQGYIVIDRVGIRVLRDPYTNKPYVSFYTTKRVGGGLLNPQPLRALKITDGVA